MQIEKIKFKELLENFQILDENIKNKMYSISRNLEYACKRFMIYVNKDNSKNLNTDKHDLLFKEFLKDTKNNYNKQEYIDYCKNNDIKINEIVNDIELLDRQEKLIRKTMETLDLLQKHLMEHYDKNVNKNENLDKNSNSNVENYIKK